MPVKSTKKPSVSTAKTVKKTTAKAPAKTKVVAEKTVAKKEATEILSPIILLKLWFEGWKKALTFKGRASRFELWIFMLINSVLASCIHLHCNYYLSPRFLRYAAVQNFSPEKIDTYINIASVCYYLAIMLPLIPIASLLVRRMHDLGKLAWKNYLEPLCYACITSSALALAISELVIRNMYPYLVLLMQVCLALTLYAIGYYILKFLITTFFYRGELKDNAYGKVQYNTDEHERLALKLSCFYFLYTGTLAILYTLTGIIEFINSL